MKIKSQSSMAVWYKRRANLPYMLLIGAAGLYILTDHWAHAAPYLPWLLILACPLMHVFMHRGHGGHGGHGRHGERNDAREASSIEGKKTERIQTD